MAFKHADRVKETTVTTGTGTYSLDGAVTGFRTFVAAWGSANRGAYCVDNGTDWEVNEGVVTDAAPDTLTRALLLASSTGSAISWGAGTKNVFAVYPAADPNPRTRRLSVQKTNNTTTGTEVTGLELTNLQPGTYLAEYYLVVQSTATATGIFFGINFTGTAANQKHLMVFPSTGGAAANGTIDDVGGASQMMEHDTATSFSTTAPNLNQIVVFATANADCMVRITTMLDVTAAGNLELWHSSETAVQTSVEAGSFVVLTRIDDA